MIYFLRNPQTDLVKIGLTENIHVRLSQLIREHGDLELIGLMEGTRVDERNLHKQFSDIHEPHAQGVEWFRPDPVLLTYIEDNAHLELPPVEHMVTVQLSSRNYQAIKLLQKRYKMRRLDDALWQFLSEHDERLTTAAEKAVRFQERIEQDLEQEES